MPSCHGWRELEDWKGEFGSDCIQRRWPDVALDLDGVAEQQGAHDASWEAVTRGQGTIF
jgi:hypothetical protein